ncbi:unnamed protein product, partial [Amoebophrya sp. A25]|eukprot:GSA25T00000012001.1
MHPDTRQLSLGGVRGTALGSAIKQASMYDEASQTTPLAGGSPVTAYPPYSAIVASVAYLLSHCGANWVLPLTATSGTLAAKEQLVPSLKNRVYQGIFETLFTTDLPKRVERVRGVMNAWFRRDVTQHLIAARTQPPELQEEDKNSMKQEEKDMQPEAEPMQVETLEATSNNYGSSTSTLDAGILDGADAAMISVAPLAERIEHARKLLDTVVEERPLALSRAKGTSSAAATSSTTGGRGEAVLDAAEVERDLRKGWEECEKELKAT